MRRTTATSHVWTDPTVPFTAPNPKGRRALITVTTGDGGSVPFGFIVSHDETAGEVTVRWSELALIGDHLTQDTMTAPPGPLVVWIPT